MKKLTVVLGLLLIFLFPVVYAYFNQPHETMNSLYQKIPEQVRESSQLIAAYYSSQNGDKEYQFAFYNPQENEWMIYKFQLTKTFGIISKLTHQKIICRSLFNYSILSNDPKALLKFKPCDNCRALLYKGHWYVNEEITRIYPSPSSILSKRETYAGITGFKSKEITSEEVTTLHGDAWVHRAFGVWPGIILLPTGENDLRALWVEITIKNESSVLLKAHYPGNVTFTKAIPINSTAGSGSYFMGVSGTFSFKDINPEVLRKNYQSVEYDINYWVLVISLSGNPTIGRLWWIDTEGQFVGRALIYPEVSIGRKEKFSDLRPSCLAGEQR